jgi:hypothetical protein
MKIIFSCVFLIILALLYPGPASAQDGFTQADRERLVRVETTLQVFMEQVDKRFEQMDKRFEQVDKRFEQVDKRFEQLTSFLWMIVGIFTAIAAANIGFAYWDRRTAVNRTREETIRIIEKEGRLRDVIQALRDLARDDPRVASVLRQFHLL